MKPLPRTLNAAALLLLAALAFTRMISLPETDILFGIYHGQQLLAGSPIVAPDTRNFQTAGELWVSNSWLWDAVLAIIYGAAGLVGIAAFNALMYAASIAAAWALCTRLKLVGWRRALISISYALASITFFTARAVDADIALLLAYALAATLLRDRVAGKVQIMVAAALAATVSALEMNLHLSGSAFVLLTPAIALITLAPASWRSRLALAVSVATASALGTLATPYGLAGITKALTVADASRRFIVEWNRPDLHTDLGWIVLAMLAAALAVVVALVWRRRYISAATLLVLEVAAFEAIRATIYVVAFATVAAAVLSAAEEPRWHPQLTAANRRLIATLATLIAATCAALAAATLAQPTRLMHIQPADYAPFAPHSRVLSDPSQGSAILFYRRNVQVAVDGRNDLLGAKRYLNATSTFGYATVPQLRAWLDHYRVDGAYLTRKRAVAFGYRFAQLGWVAHRGEYGVAYTRQR